MTETPCKTWQCRTCGFIYDEAAGRPEDARLKLVARERP